MTAPRRRRFDLRESAGHVALAIALLCAANLAFALIFIRPLTADLRALDSDAGTTLDRVGKRKKEIEGLEAYVRQIEETRANLARLRDDVLSTRDRKMIESQLEVARTAESFGTTFEQLRFENEILEDEELERFGVVVPLEGGYANLRKFIQAIERSERFLVIERVALEQGQDGGSLLQLNITVATYFIAPRRFGDGSWGAVLPAVKRG